MRVFEVMTGGVLRIDEDETVKEAMRKMHEWRISSLIVGNEGIVTRRDILTKAIAREKNPEETKVGEIMSNPVVTVHPDATVEEMLRLVREKDIGKFPVAHKGKIVGFISSGDVLRAMVLENKKRAL